MAGLSVKERLEGLPVEEIKSYLQEIEFKNMYTEEDFFRDYPPSNVHFNLEQGERFTLVQNCFRHFDLETVGTTPVHLSLFEMAAAFILSAKGFYPFFSTKRVKEFLMQTLHIELDMPSSIANELGLTINNAGQEIRRMMALFLYEHQRIFLGRACELGDFSQWEFFSMNQDLKIDFDYTPDNLNADLAQLSDV